MARHEKRGGVRGGFTLVEVLVTILIMAMTLMSMTQLLQSARISRDTIQNMRETHLAGPAIMDLIEADLRGILHLSRRRDQLLRVRNDVQLGLDADHLDFVTSTDSMHWLLDGDRVLRADWCEVGYRLRPNPQLDDFLEIYRRESFASDSYEEAPFDEGRYTFLHDRVKAFDILVYSEDGPDAEPLEEWNMDAGDLETQGLPARLEITLTLELSPRLHQEQLDNSRRTVHYTRIIRLPEALRVDEAQIPRLAVPVRPSAAQEEGAGQAPGGEDAEGASGGAGGATGGARGGGGGAGSRGGDRRR